MHHVFNCSEPRQLFERLELLERLEPDNRTVQVVPNVQIVQDVHMPLPGLCPWMRLVIDCRQFVQIQVRVTLGRRKAGMTEQFLNDPQIGAAV